MSISVVPTNFRYARPLSDIEIRPGYSHVMFNEALAWLIDEVAFCPHARSGAGGALSIYPSAAWSASISMASLRSWLQPYSGYQTANTYHLGDCIWHPVTKWERSAKRVVVGGYRFNPAATWPLFVEDGQQWINRDLGSRRSSSSF